MAKIKHGHSWNNGYMSPTYISWVSMKQRCLNPRHDAFDRYGGNGITICDRWQDNFVNFLSDMGERPAGKSLDRIDTSKGYSPDNCRWATRKQQANNTKANIKLIIDGIKYTAYSASKKFVIPISTIRGRINKGWIDEEIVGLKKRRPPINSFKNIPDIQRNELIRWFYSQGCTYKEIAKYYRLSKQRIEQIIKAKIRPRVNSDYATPY